MLVGREAARVALDDKASRLVREDQYYALCVERGGETPEIAFVHLREEEGYGQILAISLYTAPEGKAQRVHTERYAERLVSPMLPHERLDGSLLVLPVSHAEIIDAMWPARPSTVLVNGK